jgi:hypothetical protein
MHARATSLLAALAVTLTAAAQSTNAPPSSRPPAESPEQLIRDVVYNELVDHREHSFFEYVDTKRTGRETIVKVEVETPAGRVSRMLSTDGQPLSSQAEAEELRRLGSLLHDSGQREKLLRDYQGDEDRIARIVGLLPNGFLYSFDGVEGDEVRLKFEPNPAFRPPSYEARVFHGMAGTLWIDAREKRLSRLQGRLVANVDFGYGLLGRLDKGGSFDMERVEAAPGCWKTRVLDVHITGHVILLKSIAKDQEEIRSHFHQVRSGLNLEEAEALLIGPQVWNGPLNAESDPAKSQDGSADRRQRPAAFALK